MNHPALRHIRNTLVAALGLAGCIERSASLPEGQPPDAALPDAALLDPDPIHCAGGEPIRTADGRETGYIRCPDDSTDRIGPATCEPIAGWAPCPEGGVGEGDTCAADTDCTDGSDGRCVGFAGLIVSVWCHCEYPCRSDADCGPGEVCACEAIAPGHGLGSRCVPAPCAGPADCGGARCGVATYGGGCFTRQVVACRTDRDTCWAYTQCPEDEFGNPTACWPPGDENAWLGREDPALNTTWHCDGPAFVCGRPLRVDTHPRRARGVRRHDWQVSGFAVARHGALATHWTTIAALEHASVASFARFSMQLMALGAPADLLADCQRAAADEVEHARMAYAIASAFAGDAIGPGPLSLDGITLDVDPASVLREVIIEGCIGETLGAVEAAEAAHAVDDPAIAAACARIAEDELRHAALGWRTARWLLACHPELSAMASTAFADGMQQAIDGITPSPDAITRRGIATRPALRSAACTDVIVPLAERLLAKGLTT